MKSFKLPLVAAFVGATLFLSCSKSNNSKSSGDAEMKYTVNGKTYDVKGTLGSDPANPSFGINATEAITTGPPKDTSYIISAVTDNLNVGAIYFDTSEIVAKTYTEPTVTLVITINSLGYGAAYGLTNDLDVTVTSVHDGMIDGTFSGTVSGASDLALTNGEFHNIKFTTVTQ